MNFLARLNRLVELYVVTIKSAVKFRLWLPFFLYALLQFLLLLICRSYVNPYIYPLLSPLVSLLGENTAENFSHYPGLYLLLPTVYSWGKLVVGVIFEGLATGLTVILFLRISGSAGRAGRKISEAFARWPQLLLVWTVITGILVAVNLLLPGLFKEFLYGSPRRMAAFEFGMGFLTVVLFSIFIYAVPAVIVYKENFIQAFKTSISFFARGPIFSFFLAAIPYLLTVPSTYLSGKAETVVSKFSPELILYILTAGILMDMIANVMMTGTVARFLDEEQ